MQRSIFIPFSSSSFSFVLGQTDGCFLEAVAFASKLEELATVKEAIEDSRRGGVIAKEFSPIFQESIGGDHGTSFAGVAIQDDIEQIIGGLLGYLFSQKQVIDDQQVGFGEELVDLFSSLELSCLEEVFEEGMGFTVDDLIASFDSGVSHGFGDVAFSGPRRTDQQGVLAVSNELAADQFIDFPFGQFGVEVPVKFGQGRALFEAGSLEAGFDEAGVAVIQLVLHQAGKYLYKRSALIGLHDPGLEGGVHAMESEGFEMLFDFG